MTSTEELAAAIVEVLENSSISRDEKIKALGMARGYLNSSNNPLSSDEALEKWRQKRDQRGPFVVVKKGKVE